MGGQPRGVPFQKKSAKAYDQPAEAISHYVMKRIGPGMSELPMERLGQAKRHMAGMPLFSSVSNELIDAQGTRAIGDLDTWESLGPGNIGGRTRALLIDPDSPDTIYSGAVSGGVWKSIDGGSTFYPLDDMMGNLAITCLAMDPTDSNTIYAGTGEGFFNVDAVRGDGIFKTTDGGATWNQLLFTSSNTNFYYVSRIVISPNNNQTLYAGTTTGIYKSNDGGFSWALVHNPGTNGGCTDLAIRTDATGSAGSDIVFAAMGNFAQATVYRNTDADGLGTWISVLTEANMGRTSLAIAPSNQNVIYALSASIDGTSNFNNGLHAVFRSTNGGGTWTAQVRNNSTTVGYRLLLTNAPGYYAWGQYYNQGWYDNVIAVDPANSDWVWVGGIDLFRSINGGVDWEIASLWWPSSSDNEYAHADQHALVFHPDYDGMTNRTLFVGNDGGLYKTTNARDNTAPINSTTTTNTGHIDMTWVSLNNSYSVTQFYHGTAYPDGSTYFGGTQDTGTIRGNDTAGSNNWSEILGGDGGYTAVDSANTNILYAENTGISIQKSTDGGLNFSSATSGISDSGASFINPFWMDPTNPSRLYTGGWYVWRTSDGATSWSQASAITTGNGSISALTTAPSNANYALAGMSDGYIHRTSSATTATSATSWPFTNPRPANGYVSWLTFDPQNAQICYATYSTFGVNHVWRSTDAGATWTSIDGTPPNNIPDIPVHAVVVHPQDSTRLYIGTDLGVFVTNDTGGSWFVENTGFANVVTESLSIQEDNCAPHLFAFTHGRGTWRVELIGLELTPESVQVGPIAGTTQIGVTALTNCSWSATSNHSWLHVTGGSPGTGIGIVNINIDENFSSVARSGTISVNGRTFTVNQDGAVCVYQIDPTDQTFSATGGSDTVAVTSQTGCAWTATSHAGWITLTGGSTGSGSGTVSYTVSENLSTSARMGTLTIAGETFTVNQDGAPCVYSIDPTSTTASSSGVSDTVSVTAQTGCAWTASSNAAWITITGGSTGSGSGTVSYTVAENLSTSSRMGTLTIAGETFTVNQDGAPCVYSIDPTSTTASASGVSDTVSITAQTGCAWTASSNAAWITLTGGSTGSGSGTVSYTVSENLSTSARMGTLTIAGETFTVNQDGAPCVYTIDPTSTTASSSGVSDTVSVTAQTGCAWTAVSHVGWITLTGGSTGSGSGTVSYTVSENLSTSARMGTLTIAGVTFTVNQDASDPCTISPDYLNAIPFWNQTETVISLLRFFECP